MKNSPSAPQKIHNLSGFPENLPAEQIAENRIKQLMKEVYELFGYTPLETPAVENMDALAPDSEHAAIGKEIYAIKRAAAEGDSEKGSKRGLRFDLTIPLARYVAQHSGKLHFPFKRYQMQKVWRGERPQAGRFREFYQSDIDVIADGELPLHYDAEVVQVIHEILKRINFGKFTVQINHRKLLQGLLESKGISADNMEHALRIIDKLDKVGIEATINSITEELGTNQDSAKELLSFLDRSIPLSDIDEFLDSIEGDSSLLEEGKSELKTVASLLVNTADDQGKIVFNPKIARGLGYYTGCVYETTVDGYEKYGSICSGGRYANLADKFTNKKLPGVGISIGLSRLLDVFMKKEGLIKIEEENIVQVMIALIGEEQRKTANEVAQKLREAGIRTDIFHDGGKKTPKQIKATESRGIPYMLFLQEDGSLSLKDIRIRQQETRDSVESIISFLKTSK